MANNHVFNLLTAGSKSYVPLLRGCTGVEGVRGPRGGVGRRGPQGATGPEGAQGPEVPSEYFSKRFIDQLNGFTPVYEGLSMSGGTLAQVAFQSDIGQIKNLLKTQAEAPNSILPFVWHRDESDPSQWVVEFKGANNQTVSTCSIRCPDREKEDALCIRRFNFKDICAYELGYGSIFEFTPGVPHFEYITNTFTVDTSRPIDRTTFFGLRPGCTFADRHTSSLSGQWFIHCRREAMDFEHYNDTELYIHGVDGTYPRIRFSTTGQGQPTYIDSYSSSFSSSNSGLASGITYNFTRIRSVIIDSLASNTITGFHSPIRDQFASRAFPIRRHIPSNQDNGVVQTRSPFIMCPNFGAYDVDDLPSFNFNFDGVPQISDYDEFHTWHPDRTPNVWTGSGAHMGNNPNRCGFFYGRATDNDDPFGGSGGKPRYYEQYWNAGIIAVPALREGFFLSGRSVSSGFSATVGGHELFTTDDATGTDNTMMLVRFDAFNRPQRFLFLTYLHTDGLDTFVKSACKTTDQSKQTEILESNLAQPGVYLNSVIFTIVDVEQRDPVNLSAGSTPVDSAAQHPEAVATVDFVTQYVQGVLS